MTSFHSRDLVKLISIKIVYTIYLLHYINLLPFLSHFKYWINNFILRLILNTLEEV